MGNTKVLVSMTEEQVSALDKLVDMGIYSSRSEAIRDASRMLIRQQLGSLAHLKSEKNSVQLARESRKELWKKAMKKAKGDEEKAIIELKKLVKQ